MKRNLCGRTDGHGQTDSAIDTGQEYITLYSRKLLYMVGNVSVLVKNIYIWQTVCIHMWSETLPSTRYIHFRILYNLLVNE